MEFTLHAFVISAAGVGACPDANKGLRGRFLCRCHSFLPAAEPNARETIGCEMFDGILLQVLDVFVFCRLVTLWKNVTFTALR